MREIKGKSTLFQNSNPTKDHWLVAGGTNIAGLSYQFVITMTGATVLMNFGRGSTDENKAMFDAFFAKKDELEKKFGDKLNWERLDDKKSSRISYFLPSVNYFNKEEWAKIIDFLITNINKLETATKGYLPLLKQILNNPDSDTTE